jgi:hypothetical protein
MKKAATNFNNSVPTVTNALKTSVISLVNLAVTTVYVGAKGIADAAQRGQLFLLEKLNEDNQYRNNLEIITYAACNAKPIYEEDVANLVKQGALAAKDEQAEMEKRIKKKELLSDVGHFYKNMKINQEWTA